MTITEVAFDDVGNAGNPISTTEYPALGAVDGTWLQTVDNSVKATFDTAGAQLRTPLLGTGGASIRFYWRRVGAEQSTNMNMLDVRDASNNRYATTRQRSGAGGNFGDIQIRDVTTAVWVSSAEFPNDSWGRFEAQYDVTNGLQSVRLFEPANVEGTVPSNDRYGLLMNRQAGTLVDHIRLGSESSNSSMSMEIRNFAFSDQLEWIGPYVPPVAGITHFVWDGTTEKPATLTVWDGTQEIAVDATEIHA